MPRLWPRRFLHNEAVLQVPRQIRVKAWNRRNLLAAGVLLQALSHAWLFMRMSGTPARFATLLPGQIIGSNAIGLMLPSLADAAVARFQPSGPGAGSEVNGAIHQPVGSPGVALTIGMTGGSRGSIEDFRKVYLTLVCAGLTIALLGRRISDPRGSL